MILNLIGITACCDKEKCFHEVNYFISHLGYREVLSSPDEVCAEEMRVNGYKNELMCCKTVKLFVESIPDMLKCANTGGQDEYKLVDGNGNTFWLTIDEVNTSEKYIVVQKNHSDFSSLVLGGIELTCVLDYDKLPDMDKLEALGFQAFPSFHETHMEILKRDEDRLHLRFSGGFHPLVTDIKMTGIFKEESIMEDDIAPGDYFMRDGYVGAVEFETTDRGYVVKISDNFTSHKLIGWYEGISFEEIYELEKDPGNTKIEDHINEYTIYCTDISFDFKSNIK
ncbi:hypothetical protein [Candidatus Soleaferrea massiliensis]|uniref:hypothetical protein n=1 Tax=Candidatus Soleaferrea massiliensis TaxID=1470354 RepID=UPI00058BF7DB|nr:hypothetical protein [Candidatus Soleaferrea massiliensis]